MMIKQTVMSDLAIPPGEYLEEVLEEMEISQAELARRIGRPPQAINEIIKGEKAITPETALQLEQVLRVSANFWSNLEAEYQLILAKKIQKVKAEEEIKIVGNYPYLDLCKLELVEKTRNNLKKVTELRKFFAVSSLFNIKDVKEYLPAFRQVAKETVSHENLVAWLRAGHILASKMELEIFDKKKLENYISKITELSRETDPNILLKNLKSLLAACGVALVVIPHFPKTYTTGATFWIGKAKAVVMMSLRGSWSDIFWFSLFHEIGHILRHDKRLTFLEDNNTNTQYVKQEAEADYFAQETLLPTKYYDKFIKKGDFSPLAIKEFADKIKVYAGIVTGRLQHDKKLQHSANYHRIRYKWEKRS